MKCPNCGTAIHLWTDCAELSTEAEDVGDPVVSLQVGFCPECQKPIIDMDYGFIDGFYPGGSHKFKPELSQRIYPSITYIEALDPAVPSQYADRYYEAAQVLPISPKSSATLSRYLLQMVLHEELGIKKRNLEEEICELENQQVASGPLVRMLQVFRKIANFGAHPKKSSNSNEIVDVATGEAEVMLDLLRELFDCIFVKPKKEEEFLAQIYEKYGIEG